MSGSMARERRRLALQSTAELDRGLEILDKELRLGRLQSARETVAMLRSIVRVADATLVEYLRNNPDKEPDSKPVNIPDDFMDAINAPDLDLAIDAVEDAGGAA